jgi:hypothetical protein
MLSLRSTPSIWLRLEDLEDSEFNSAVLASQTVRQTVSVPCHSSNFCQWFRPSPTRLDHPPTLFPIKRKGIRNCVPACNDR